MENALKAAIYARYSSSNQREESIEAQVRAIEEYAIGKDIEIVDKYIDEAKSATSDNRPSFQQMVKDVQSGRFNCIIVHKLDRFSRDRYDSAYYKRILKKNGIQLISVLEKLDDSPESIILESVLEGMAEYYSKNLGREVMKGMKETALQCKHTGGAPPLGYDVLPDKTYAVNEKEAEAVRFIFEAYADGQNYPYIIKTLNENGCRTKNGNYFANNSLFQILSNEKYAGIFTFNKSTSKVAGKRNSHSYKNEAEIIRVENGMPQIVSKELFEKVQTIREKKKRKPDSTTENYLLSGLIVCGCCGANMVGHRRGSATRKYVSIAYECSSKKSKEIGCTSKAINRDKIEQYVLNMLPGANRKSLEDIRRLRKENEVKTLNNTLTNVENRISNLIDIIEEGKNSHSIKERLDKLEMEKSSIKEKIKGLEEQTSENSDENNKIMLADRIDRIKLYVEKVIYSDKDNIEIIFKN